MKKIKIRRPKNSHLVLGIIIAVQFALIATLAYYLHFTRQEVGMESTIRISTLINKAVDAITLPIPQDARTGALYIHQARLTLPPAPQNSEGVLYFYYSPSYTGADAQVTLVDKQNIDINEAKVYDALNFQQVFAAVPKLQACARGYQLFFKPQTNLDGAVETVFSKQLNDGRMIYVYLDKGCTDNSNQMIPYLERIQSF